MTKEYLEAFETVYNNIDYLISDVVIEDNEVNDCLTSIWKQLPNIKQALHRLEAIDNANTSEVMKCLDRMNNFVIHYALEDCPNTLREAYFKDYTTIKQALLKAQEPKNYLKWEDLEFKEEIQEMKVLLNGKTYVLDYKFYTCEHNVIHLSTLEYDRLLTCCGDYGFDKQFFDDLHLERVE